MSRGRCKGRRRAARPHFSALLDSGQIYDPPWTRSCRFLSSQACRGGSEQDGDVPVSTSLVGGDVGQGPARPRRRAAVPTRAVQWQCVWSLEAIDQRDQEYHGRGRAASSLSPAIVKVDPDTSKGQARRTGPVSLATSATGDASVTVSAIGEYRTVKADKPATGQPLTSWLPAKRGKRWRHPGRRQR